MSKTIIDTWHAIRPSMEFDNTTIVFVPTKEYLCELCIQLKGEPDICSTVMTGRDQFTARFLTFTVKFVIYIESMNDRYAEMMRGHRSNVFLIDPVGVGRDSKQFLKELAQSRGKTFKCVELGWS